MLLGALLDLGVPPSAVRRALGRLRIPPWSWRISRVRRLGFRSLRVEVRLRSRRTGAARGLIARLVRGGRKAGLSASVMSRGSAIVRAILRAESAAHGERVGHVHLHEIEDIDTAVDVFGSLIALEILGVRRVWASGIGTGCGRVRTRHGSLPVPAPAAAELLRGLTVSLGTGDGELATPTGAALVSGLAEPGVPPPMRLLRVGCGAGARDTADRPNMVRAFLCETVPGAGGPGWNVSDSGESVCQIDAVVDDMSPQLVQAWMERVYGDGALEAWTAPVTMKNNRPGIALTVLAPSARLDAMVRACLEETATLGVRITRPDRVRLDRREVRLRTRWGKLRFKLAGSGSSFHAVPEWREVRRLAARAGVPARLVLEEARGLWRGMGGPRGRPHI